MAFDELIDRVRDLMHRAADQAGEVGEALMVIEPTPPYGGRGAATVLITAAALISIALLGGVGLASMIIMLLALGIIFMILSAVFGISFDMDPAEIFRQGAGAW
jgi:hypothetical protein